MMQFTMSGTMLRFDETTLRFSFSRDGATWSGCDGIEPQLTREDRSFSFAGAATVTHERIETGTGVGVRSVFAGFAGADYAFETYIWIERSSGDVLCEWVPLRECGAEPRIDRVLWPAPLSFDHADAHDVTLITHEQGVMIPNNWPTEVGTDAVSFGGRFETAGGYMPWFAQLRSDGHAYIAICETPWNAGYDIDHPAGGPYTHVGMWFEPSLGRMDYRRVVRYRLLDHADHTAVCKTYRAYVNERGRLRTLAEKAARNPSVRDLLGRSWVHVGIKTKVQPDSSFYDPAQPGKNDSLVTFAQRERQMRTLHEMGAGRLYLHLDGWAQPGYDNGHPDYLPACREAGGWKGMKSLVDACHETCSARMTNTATITSPRARSTRAMRSDWRTARCPSTRCGPAGAKRTCAPSLRRITCAATSVRSPRTASRWTARIWTCSPAMKATNARIPSTA
jgi:hypothetical protein